MALATYPKARVLAAVEAAMAQLHEASLAHRSGRLEVNEAAVAEEIRPRWYRPWKLSEEKARRRVRSREFSGWDWRSHLDLLAHYSKQLNRLARIRFLITSIDGDEINLTEDEAALLFA